MHKHLVYSVSPLGNDKLFLVSTDSEERVYDLAPLYEEIPVFQILRTNKELYSSVRPEANGYAIVWNDELDLASDELYLNGSPVY